MKKLLISAFMALALFGTMLMAGGDVAPISEPVKIEVKADSGFYVGGGYTYALSDVDIQNINLVDGQYNNGGLLLAGYDFNKYVGVEGRYTFIADNTWDAINGGSSKVGGGAWGLFVKPQYPLGEDFKVYGLLGYGKADLSGTDADLADWEGSFQYGAGVAYNLTRNVGLFVDVTSLLVDGDLEGGNINGDTYATNFGVTYKF